MGIKNLNFLIEKYSPAAINYKYLCVYEYKYIAIDISIYLYKFIYRNGDALELLAKQVMRLLKNRVIPVYIFDGKPPNEKSDVLNERRNIKKESLLKQEKIKEIIKIKEELKKGDRNEQNEKIIEIEEKINEEIKIINIIENKLNNIEKETEAATETEINEYINEYGEMLMGYEIEDLMEELEKLKKNMIIIDKKVIDDCKKLLTNMGIPYIVANGEAEALCARLIQKGYVMACLSEDMDILANGGKLFLRNFNENNNKVLEYDLDKILKNFEMDYNQFVDLCILCKCDYTTTITNIGRERAYTFIKKYKTIENIIDFIKTDGMDRYIVPNDFDYINARRLFLTCGENENFEELKKKMRLSKPVINKVIEMLEDKSKINTIKDIKINLEKFHNNLYESLYGKEKSILSYMNAF